jgi:sugar diacid utilization regulator
MKAQGVLDLPVTEQFKLAVHLQQPNPSWRGDHTQAVLKEKKDRQRRFIRELKAIKKEV